jgi:hypothetical protein
MGEKGGRKTLNAQGIGVNAGVEGFPPCFEVVLRNALREKT